MQAWGRAPATASLPGTVQRAGRAPASGHSGRVLEDPSVSRIIGSLLPGAALRVKGVLTTQHLAPCSKL